MIVIPGERAVFFDVDDTLVLWSAKPEELEAHGVSFQCPAGGAVIDDEIIPSSPWSEFLLPHRKHIARLIKHKKDGDTVIVWSAGGYDWAESVVRTLGLEDYVDLIISKPYCFYDDLTPGEFMGQNCYIK
jgi:FMN phosphatase YigB (HAD superfamily)